MSTNNTPLGIARIEHLQWLTGEVNKANGWRDSKPDQTSVIITQLALITTEVSEAIEEIRNGRGPAESYEINGKPEGVPSELADIVIRAMDFADIHGIDLSKAILNKLDYNATRGHRHGGKKA